MKDERTLLRNLTTALDSLEDTKAYLESMEGKPRHLSVSWEFNNNIEDYTIAKEAIGNHICDHWETIIRETMIDLMGDVVRARQELDDYTKETRER